MTVIVAGRLIQEPASLSELGRQVLACIDGGPEWLAWAIPHGFTCFASSDESMLLDEVQQGLHGSPLTLLPRLGLLVSPLKLMTLGSAKLRLLTQCEAGSASDGECTQVQRILAENSLLTAQQLNDAGGFLHACGIASAPLFQAVGFNDRIALCELAASNDGAAPEGAAPDSAALPALHREAAAFAVEQARTVPEFCDYFQVYLVHVRKLGALSGTVAERAQLVSQAMRTLLPLGFGALDCPQLDDRLPAPQEVEHALHNWLARGCKIGFARLSQAVLQIVTHTAFTSETGAGAARLFDLYLNGAQTFLASQRIGESRLGQDGASSRYTLRSADQHALLGVDASRVLSLAGFGSGAAASA